MLYIDDSFDEGFTASFEVIYKISRLNWNVTWEKIGLFKLSKQKAVVLDFAFYILVICQW